jgi:RNA polymerase sigma factor (sigma-70 family)
MSNRLIAVLMKQTRQMIQARQPVSDAVLVQRFTANRDESAFAGLMQRHGPMVWAVCRNSLRREADAEDAFQATFLALVQSGKRIREQATIGAWLHGVAVRICLKARQSSARRALREARAAKAIGAESNGDSWFENLAEVHARIRQLPPQEHTVFVLCVLEGMPQAEVARRLGWKLNSISSVLARARRRLQAYLKSNEARSLLALTLVASSPAAVPAALLSQACSLANSTAGVSQVVLSLAAIVTEVSMRKLIVLSVWALVVSSGVAIGTSMMGTAEAQPPSSSSQPAPSYDSVVHGYVTTASKSPVEHAPSPKWEYKTLRCATGALDAEANALGASGWELVSMNTVPDSSQWLCMFKRPRQVISTQGDFSVSFVEGAHDQPEYLVFHLQKADAAVVTEELKHAVNAKVVYDPRTNTVHVQCEKPEVFRVRGLIEKMDGGDKTNQSTNPAPQQKK